MSLERLPQLGTSQTVVALNVKLSKASENDATALSDSLRGLYQRGEFTDVAVTCAGQTFPAHKAVLAAQSEVMLEEIKRGGDVTLGHSGRQEIRLAGVSNPEAVSFMLDCLYEIETQAWKDYNPRTQEINKDVLRLAQQFRLPALAEKATYWLSKDLTTGNVVERLQICEEFGLEQLSEKIIEQLTINRRALTEVANSPQIMSHPKLMQALLRQAAAGPSDVTTLTAAQGASSERKDVLAVRGAPKKKARKA